MLVFILSVYTVHALGRSFERKGRICQSYFHCCTVHVASIISLIFQLMHTIYTLKKH